MPHTTRVYGSEYYCTACGRHWDLDEPPNADEECDRTISDITSVLKPASVSSPTSTRLPNHKPKYHNRNLYRS